jgi:hypothetical protein
MQLHLTYILPKWLFLEVIHPCRARSHVRWQGWHHLTPQLAQHSLEQLLVGVQRIKAAAQFRQAMVQVAHAIAARAHWQVTWLSHSISSTAAVAGSIVEAGEAGHLPDRTGSGACGVHGGLELCEGGVHEGW